MTSAPSLSFVFVCQAGRLEVDALMLALSLRRFAGLDCELIAAVPITYGGLDSLHPDIRAQLDRLNVRVVEIENHLDADYPIGNKVSCLAVPTDADRLVFVDSDVICLAPFVAPPEFAEPIAAKPADLATAGLDDSTWRRAYAALDLEPPAGNVTATVSGASMHPYFNSGVVAVDSRVGFGAAWLEACAAIDADPSIRPTRPWLDQIGLPVAASKLGLRFGVLTERHNFPAHLRRVPDHDPPVLCHYHHPKHLARSRSTVSVVRQLGAEHPLVWDLMRDQEEWAPIVRLGRPGVRTRVASVPAVAQARRAVAARAEGWSARRTPAGERSRNVIVTGFPRSGTSLYASLLDSIPNVVCLNEVSSRTVAPFFRRTRRRILAGQPVQNRYSPGGGVTTDTMAGGTWSERRVMAVEDEHFVLAQKFTLPYLNRLAELCAAGLDIWVVVRDPRHTIGSWKRCPPHFAIANIDPPDVHLAHIPMTGRTTDERRTEIWNHYARVIDGVRDQVTIVRYEDLVADPRHELARFCARYGLAAPSEVPDLHSRNRPDAAGRSPDLDALVTARCELGLFGYE